MTDQLPGQMSIFDFIDPPDDRRPFDRDDFLTWCDYCYYQDKIGVCGYDEPLGRTCVCGSGFIENDTIWDDDIRYIDQELTRIALANGYKNGDTTFYVWEHCSHYGYRLNHQILICKDNPKESQFMEEMDVLVKDAKKRGVELSPMWQAVWWLDDNEDATLYCYTLFLDNRRKIRKKEVKA